MPNWCSNTLVFPNDVAKQRAVDILCANGTKASFENIIPMPTNLHVVNSSDIPEAVMAYLATLDADALNKTASKLRFCSKSRMMWSVKPGGDINRINALSERIIKVLTESAASDTAAIIQSKETLAPAIAELGVTLDADEPLPSIVKTDQTAALRLLIALDALAKDVGVEPFHFDESDPHNLTSIVDYGERIIENVITYGHATWYEWSIATWGCKWDCSYADVDGEYICFQTPWNPALPVVQELARQAQTPIAYYYDDEQFCVVTGAYLIDANGTIMNTTDGVDDGFYSTRDFFLIAAFVSDCGQDEHRYDDEAEDYVSFWDDPDIDEMTFEEFDKLPVLSYDDLVFTEELQALARELPDADAATLPTTAD